MVPVGTIKIRWGKEKGDEDRQRWEDNAEGIDFSDAEFSSDSDFDDQKATTTSASSSSREDDAISIRSKSEVTGLLQDVTRRLLGPSPTGFSDSVIVLHIVDHSVSDFEAIDTPGIVETGFPEDVILIHWLKEMVSGYMRQEKTIILAAIECTGTHACV